ncbi:hypothetical protein CAEBREN_04198 [Caenorhabditis brenneri]|uniref:SET domain-containing protein n=1 Tax=Caenorhabditis brenneri TaxID=135651 RepID=G0MDB6_CAEBE|nr:hypothetical protein CAEBREN_04198 [Caenorhabditis brenneri]
MPPRPEDRKISNEMRRAILNNCEFFPGLSKPKLTPGKNNEEFQALCELVNSKFPKHDHVTAATVSETISVAKSSMLRKLTHLILVARITKDEVEDRMKTWEFYDDFKFYRKNIHEAEKKLWEKKAAGSVRSDGSGPSSSVAPPTSSTPGVPSKPDERKVSDEMRRAILQNCENFPALTKPNLKPSRHPEEFRKLCELVNKKFPKEQHVNAKMAAVIISNAKTILTRKLRYLIQHHRLTESEVEDRMKTWEFYSDFKFYRQNIHQLEKELWEEQAVKNAPNVGSGSSSSAPASTSSAPAQISSTTAPTSSTSAPTSSTSAPNQGSSIARSAKLQIQKLHMSLVKKGRLTGGLRSGNAVYARNSRSALRAYQKKHFDAAITKKPSTKKRPVIIRSAALTAAITSAAKLRKTGVKINAPAPTQSNAAVTPSSVSRSRFLNGLAATNIIAMPTAVTRKRANQPEFARTARLAARMEQQEAKTDDVDTTPEPTPQLDTPSSSTVVVRGAKRMKIDLSSTPDQAGSSGSTPQAARNLAVSVDDTNANRTAANAAGSSSTPRLAADPGPSTINAQKRRVRKAPAVGRFTRTEAAQPATPSVATTSTGDAQVAVTKAGKPMKARATRVQAAVAAATDDAEERSTLPLAIVIANERSQVRSGKDRIKILKEFVADVPEACTEAIRAMKFGQRIRNRQYPGIPDKKFLRNNYAKYGSDESLTWPMQAAFEMKDHPKMWYVFFEGWTIPYRYEESQLKESGEDTLEAGKIRRDFLNTMSTMNVTKDCLDQYRYCGNKRKTDALFWDYEDLSYFHTKIHFEDGLGPIFYMNLSKDCEKPPTYSYTTTNIMNVKVYNWCLRQKMNWSIQKLDASKQLNLASVEKKTGCENPSGCVCNRRFAHLYEDTINLQTENGLLKVTGFNRDSPRISIECSDACGCSHNCPRRHLQRGNKKALVVNFEGSRKGMGLRAGAHYKKGEYIGEYTGILKEPVDGEDQSYEAAVSLMAEPLVICSRKCGNIIRFMSHSCSPNAMFVVTWSRVKESDPLLPKIAVFATEDIKLGEEITICYWTAEDRDAATEFVRCWCGSKNCIKNLPVIS